jgi:quercetin dioxygenase-like cupin family protein
VQNLPLFDWKRRGGRGHFIQLYGTETKWGGYVVEVPPGGALNPEKHMYEEIFLVVEGRGSTEVWQEGDKKKLTFEWQKGSMFSIPMNAWYRHVNATSGGALLLAGNTAPNVLNQLNNVDAVFNNPFIFRDRFSGDEDFFKPKDEISPDPVRGLAQRKTNFIPDVINCELPLDNRRSVGYRRVEPAMTNNQFYFWIGQHVHGKVLFAIASQHAPNGIFGMPKIFECFQDRCFAPNFSDAGIQAGLSGCFQINKLVNEQAWDKGATEAVKSVAALLPTFNRLAMSIPKIGGQCQGT